MNFNTLIVDGPYLAHRSYQAPYKLTTSDGKDATMIHSFIRSLNSFYKKFKPDRVIIAWESHGTPSWRKELIKSYKGTRNKVDNQYLYQLKDLQKLLALLEIEQFRAPCNEADDVMARLSISVNDLHIKYPLIIFTKDKDIMQLVGPECQIYDGKTMYDIKKVEEKFFVKPEQIPDLLAIAGDKSDNIEGIKGVGFKRAAKCLRKHGCIEEIIKHGYSSKVIDKLLGNKKLTKLNFDCSLEKIPKNKPKTSIEEILNKYELNKMKEKIKEYKSMGGIYVSKDISYYL